ncbi:hypothetical protein VMCG_10368 [Cytospora schulzeri]|uniref:Uncharacterized protein n=1 Tax=Cytospora schulzeri TaxID=448051 RepID=A0A423VC72_9PEZI|nr:hypothetical protein VMCG_10368 [Valsa malicola]
MADKEAPLDSVVSTQSELKPVGPTVSPPLARSTKSSRLRAHCGRMWIYYVAAVAVILAILLPVLFTVIIPRVAQGMVNDAHLPIRSGSFEAISNNQVVVGLNTHLDGPSSLKIRMDPFDMHLYNEETDGFYPFTSVFVPAHTVNGKTELVIGKETVTVKNHTELNKWLRRAVYYKETNVSVKAETTAHWGAIKTHIKIVKTVSLHGLDQLSGLRIDAMTPINGEENGGNNFQGTFILPNHSPLSIGLGNITFNTWAGDVLIGGATVTDAYLEPGNNTIPFTGKIFLQTVMRNSADIVASQSSSLANGYLELGISGNSTIANGEHITYLEDVLNGIRIKAQLHEREVLGGLARSLIGLDRTVTLSDMLGDLMGDLDPLEVMEFVGIDLEAWRKALEDALEGNTKTGTLLKLFKDFVA